jgi:uncharacterized protein
MSESTQYSVKLLKQPSPAYCSMLASWPGIGNVSLVVAKYLKQKLNVEEIGEVNPIGFFEPVGIRVKDNIVESPSFPESKFYYWQDDNASKGLLLFIGEEQPSNKGYELINHVLNVAQKLNVRMIYSCAAAVTRIHHSEKPHVWGVATKPELLDELSKHGAALQGNLRIAGLNGLILGLAKERGLDGLCLLGEVPSFATQITNPKASLAVLEILSRMLNIDVNLEDLESMAKHADEEMERIAKRATAEFIDQFTEPIWEQGEEEEEDEEEED